MKTHTQTAQKWQTILTEFKKSGISGAQFCKKRHLPYANFNYWRKRLAASKAKKINFLPFSKTTTSPPGFVEMINPPKPTQSNETPNAWKITLKLGQSIELCVSQI